MVTPKSRERESIYRAIEALGRLTEVMARRRQQLAREAGLTPQQWRVLEEIAREDFMPSLFARNQGCAQAGVSRTLRQLQSSDLVEVSIAASDARRRDYALTPRGRESLAKLRAMRELAIQDVWQGLGSDQLDDFAVFGSELARRLESYAVARDPQESAD